jgi:hypothetical protein
MLGTVLKQYNGAPVSRIRPQSFKVSRHFFQSCISLSNSTFLSSKIQTSAYNGKRCHNNSSNKAGKGGVKRTLTSQHLAGRLDNAKNERLALFIMNNLRRQTGDLFFKGRDFLHIATGLASLFNGHLCLTFGQS